MKFYDVDRAEVLSYKADRLKGFARTRNSVDVGADYTAPDFARRLAETGFDPMKRTLVLWEGNTYYLPPITVRNTLRHLAEEIRDLQVAFAYFGSAVSEGRSPSPSMVKAISILRRIGVPARVEGDHSQRLVPHLRRDSERNGAQQSTEERGMGAALISRV